MKQQVEELLRADRIREAETRLLELNLPKIAREEAVAYANLARRAQRPDLALRILHPIVRQSKGGAPPTPAEKIEYAQSLRKLGAINEAISILDGIAHGGEPEAFLHLGFCYTAKWDPDHAIQALSEYLAHENLPEYLVATAKVNLASSLLTKADYPDAEKLLEEILSSTERSTFRLLHANCLELLAQVDLLHYRNWKSALERLEQCRGWIDVEGSSLAALFIRKWQAVALSHKDGTVAPHLRAVRDEATRLGHWETLRDCEFHIATLEHDVEGLLRIYFGTPYPLFKEKIARILGADVPDFYLWGMGKAGESRTFDLAHAYSDDLGAKLAPGSALHQLLVSLAADFYKPIPLLSLFSRLFPDEQFNPFSSPNRVHQLLHRLRRWFESEDLPLEVEEIRGGYRLSPRGNVLLRVPRETLPTSTKELEFLALCLTMESSEFTTSEAVKATGLSRSTIQRLVRWGVENQKLTVSGNARQRAYKVVEQQ